ncbi:MAG TPA: HNH endonuclease signature motif containing protein [Phycisphaerae bacterium]|nr:HNH endonuclease signature motif containing protein [Phycisphaerae bacterium]
MSHVPADLHRAVIERSAGRCEYCRLAQLGQEATFHVDHVIPISAGGRTQLDNLAWACVSCSLRKAARQSAMDPQTGEAAPLFNPRVDEWSDHFRWDGPRAIGLTPIGRATIVALQMNRPLILAIRAEETKLGRHPTD